MFIHVAEPPRITTHPQELKDAVQGKPVTFTVQAIGTEPLNYHWRWKPATEDGSEQWQSCDAEWCDGATLTIPSVQQFNTGSYCCVVSNSVGTQISKAAQLSVGKNPMFKPEYKVHVTPQIALITCTSLIFLVRGWGLDTKLL